MIVYFRSMRTKDDEKIAALFEATVKLVNEIGFASSSVSKIAHEAGVSPATIYVYYQNKEELLVSTYTDIKRNMSEAVLKNFDNKQSVRDIFRHVWFNMFHYISNHRDYFEFAEQFSNSPYSLLVNKEDVEKYFEPVITVLQTGIDEKILKDVNLDILGAFIFYPIMILANSRLCQNFDLNEENIDSAFTLAWDAIKR